MANTINSQVIGTTVYMKEWFYRKNYLSFGEYDKHFCIILKETEKAYRVTLYSSEVSYTHICWIPKSCTLMTIDEFFKEIDEAARRQEEWEARRQERFEAACKAYADLIAFAKANGVRGVREGLRRETIEQKILSAGLELPTLQ